jgi:hypothetical protein
MTDLQRKYVLALPDSNLSKILRTSLAQWAMRLKRKPIKQRPGDTDGE